MFTDIPQHATQLMLDGNNLDVLHEHSFIGQKLLRRRGAGVFRMLLVLILKTFILLFTDIPQHATQLMLDGNNLGVLHEHSFIGQQRLELLRLNDSDIQHIENDTFRGLEKLKVGLLLLYL